MHRHLPYPEDGDALFHDTKEKWQGEEINITDAQYFVPAAILNSPTHTPQHIERIVFSFFKCSSLQYFNGDASSRGGLKASPKRKKNHPPDSCQEDDASCYERLN